MKKRMIVLSFLRSGLASPFAVTLLLCLLAAAQAMAQSRVSGTVTDETQKPLNGVSVQVKGTATGTTTDASGNYSVSVPNANATLVFSYVTQVAS